MWKELGLRAGAFVLATGALGIAGQYLLVDAMAEKSTFTVNSVDPSCARNAASVFRSCSFETSQGTFKIGNFATDLHSEDREALYGKLAPGKTFEATYINSTLGRVVLKLEPKP